MAAAVPEAADETYMALIRFFPMIPTPRIPESCIALSEEVTGLALAACAGVPVKILDPGCTSKTFPTYFKELSRVTLDADGRKRSALRRLLAKLAFWKK